MVTGDFLGWGYHKMPVRINTVDIDVNVAGQLERRNCLKRKNSRRNKREREGEKRNIA